MTAFCAWGYALDDPGIAPELRSLCLTGAILSVLLGSLLAGADILLARASRRGTPLSRSAWIALIVIAAASSALLLLGLILMLMRRSGSEPSSF